MIPLTAEYQIMTTIRVADFYGNIKAYRGMSEATFNLLEDAFLNNEPTVDITTEEYESILSLMEE